MIEPKCEGVKLMYTDEELKNILLDAIASHQSLDHKLHLMEAVEAVFKNIKQLKEDKQVLSHYKFMYEQAKY
jgi:hypothetical protein